MDVVERPGSFVITRSNIDDVADRRRIGVSRWMPFELNIRFTALVGTIELDESIFGIVASSWRARVEIESIQNRVGEDLIEPLRFRWNTPT